MCADNVDKSQSCVPVKFADGFCKCLYSFATERACQEDMADHRAISAPECADKFLHLSALTSFANIHAVLQLSVLVTRMCSSLRNFEPECTGDFLHLSVLKSFATILHRHLAPEGAYRKYCIAPKCAEELRRCLCSLAPGRACHEVVPVHYEMLYLRALTNSCT